MPSGSLHFDAQSLDRRINKKVNVTAVVKESYAWLTKHSSKHSRATNGINSGTRRMNDMLRQFNCRWSSDLDSPSRRSSKQQPALNPVQDSRLLSLWQPNVLLLWKVNQIRCSGQAKLIRSFSVSAQVLCQLLPTGTDCETQVTIMLGTYRCPNGPNAPIPRWTVQEPAGAAKTHTNHHLSSGSRQCDLHKLTCKKWNCQLIKQLITSMRFSMRYPNMLWLGLSYA